MESVSKPWSQLGGSTATDDYFLIDAPLNEGRESSLSFRRRILPTELSGYIHGSVDTDLASAPITTRLVRSRDLDEHLRQMQIYLSKKISRSEALTQKTLLLLEDIEKNFEDVLPAEPKYIDWKLMMRIPSSRASSDLTLRITESMGAEKLEKHPLPDWLNRTAVAVFSSFPIGALLLLFGQEVIGLAVLAVGSVSLWAFGTLGARIQSRSR